MTDLAVEAHSTTALTPIDLQALQALLAQEDFPEFIRQVYPWFIMEEAHIAVIRHLEAAEAGECDRLAISIAPRTGKSTLICVLFPAWYLGRHPDHTVMIASHAEPLASRFGEELIALLKSEVYKRIFPHIILKKSSSTDFTIMSTESSRVGRVLCVGVGTGIAGNGFHLGLIDDAISEQDADSDPKKDKAEIWYRNGFYTRRSPDSNAIVQCGTRWAFDDLMGRTLEQGRKNPDADQYRVLNIPAVLDTNACRLLTRYAMTDPMLAKDIQVQVGGSFAPRRHKLSEIKRSKATLTERSFSAQYMGKPNTDEGAIIKRKYWRKWPTQKPPECTEILLCYDTAFTEDEQNDPSAMTAWGVFQAKSRQKDDDGKDTGREYEHFHAVLLGAWQEHLEATKLLPRVREDVKFFKPDRILVEKRASGIQLIQELRRARLPAHPWLPPGPPGAKGKRPRAHAASIPMAQGCVWYMPGEFADEVIDQAAEYPFGARDDLLDTVSMMLIYLRRRYHLNIITDEPSLEEEKDIALEAKRRAFTGRRLYGRRSVNREAQDAAMAEWGNS